MQIQPQEILDRVDELWAIHAYGCDLESEVQHGYLALIVDSTDMTVDCAAQMWHRTLAKRH